MNKTPSIERGIKGHVNMICIVMRQGFHSDYTKGTSGSSLHLKGSLLIIGQEVPSQIQGLALPDGGN